MLPCSITPIAYQGWPNCYRLSNGIVELIVTTDVGPRVIRCGFVDGPNLFVEMEGQLGKCGEADWMLRGGHRLWIAPEIVPDTYALDNAPVQATVGQDCIHLLQPREPETGLQKEMTLRLLPDGQIVVLHRILNAGTQTRRSAVWAISAMAAGGIGFCRFPPRGCHSEHLRPTHPLVMWAYTDFTDPRWCLAKHYMVLKQDRAMHHPQKAGIFNPEVLAAYLLDSQLFVKRSSANPNLTYPDFHCSFEMFTNGDFLELETLGPLTELHPGHHMSHTEVWTVHRDVRIQSLNEAELDRILPAT
jgi:hypothetical protein